MEITDRADGVDVRAVVGADGLVLWWERLQVPVWWHVGLGEAFVWQEVERWSLVACCHDDHVCGFDGVAAWAVLGYALGAALEGYAFGDDFDDVAA